MKHSYLICTMVIKAPLVFRWSMADLIFIFEPNGPRNWQLKDIKHISFWCSFNWSYLYFINLSFLPIIKQWKITSMKYLLPVRHINKQLWKVELCNMWHKIGKEEPTGERTQMRWWEKEVVQKPIILLEKCHNET